MKRVLKYFIFALALIIPQIALAANLTKDDLTAAAEYFNGVCSNAEEKEAFSDDEGNCVSSSMTVGDETINVTAAVNGQSGTLEVHYQIKEDGKIEYSVRVPIQKGMTKTDYKKLKETPKTLLLPALLVSKARGGKMKDYLAYLEETMLEMLESQPEQGQGGQGQGGPGQGQGGQGQGGGSGQQPGNPEELSDEEFGNHIIEIVQHEYGQAPVLKDNQANQINSFEQRATFTSSSEEQGYIDFILIIDSNADFTKIAGLYDSGEIGGLENPVTSLDPVKEEDNPGTGAAIPVVVLSALFILGIVLFKQYDRRAIHKI